MYKPKRIDERSRESLIDLLEIAMSIIEDFVDDKPVRGEKTSPTKRAKQLIKDIRGKS